MKRRLAVMMWVVILAQSLGAATHETCEITRMFTACIPTNWVVAPSTNLVPVRGLSNPMAQLTFTETNTMLTFDLGSGRTTTFHPTLILLAFPSDRAREIDEAVIRGMIRSDYPPFVFCTNDQYVFVTFPAYINQGWHTPEAEASLKELKAGLAKCTTPQYPTQDGPPGPPSTNQ